VQGVAWQWIFWLSVPIGVLLVPVIGRRITESAGPAGNSTSSAWCCPGWGAAVQPVADDQASSHHAPVRPARTLP